MFMDIVSIMGDTNYRGITRNLDGSAAAKRRKTWREFFPLYEQYMDWYVDSNQRYSAEMLEFLKRMQNVLAPYGASCEIILFSDHEEPIPQQKVSFLGFDVCGDDFESAIQVGNKIDDIYLPQLNGNGLFDSYENALDFCAMWNQLIAAGKSPWEYDGIPRPFYVWRVDE